MLKLKQKTRLVKITAFLYVASFFFNSIGGVAAQEAQSSSTYSNTHAFNLVGAADMEGDQFKVDEDGRLVNYTGTLFDEGDLYPGTREMDRENKGSFLNSFYNASDIMRQRYGHTVTPLSDGKLLIAGGSNGYTTLSSTALYDPVTKTFFRGPKMLVSRNYHTATPLPNGDVVLVGGLTSGAPGRLGDVEGLAPLSNGEVYLAQENRFVSLGGYIKYHRSSSFIESSLSTEVTKEDDLTDILMNSRARHSAALLPGGNQLLLLGTTPIIRGGVGLDESIASEPPVKEFRESSLENTTTKKLTDHYNYQITSEINKLDIPSGDLATLTIKTSADFRDPNGKKPGLLNNPSALITVEVQGKAVLITENEIGQKDLPVRKKHTFNNFFQRLLGLNYVKPLQEENSERKLYIAFPPAEPGTLWAMVTVTSKFPADNTGRTTYQKIIISNNNTTPGEVSTAENQYKISDVSDIVVYRDPEDYSFASNSEQVTRSILRNNDSARPSHFTEEPFFQYLLGQALRPTIYATSHSNLNEAQRIARDHGFDASPVVFSQDLFKEFEPPKYLKKKEFEFEKDADFVILVPNLPKISENTSPDEVIDDEAGVYGEILDLNTGQTTSLPEGVVSSLKPSIHAMANGKLLIAGGGYDWVTLYDPAARSFKRLAKLTIPRVGYQVLPTLDSSGRLDKLIVLGGLPTTKEAEGKMKQLVASNQLPAEVFDVTTFSWTDPLPLPKLVGTFANLKLNTSELKSSFKCLENVEFGTNNRPSPNTILPVHQECWKRSRTIAQGLGYDMSLILSLWPNFDITETTIQALSSITSFVAMKDNAYFALTSRGSVVLNLNESTVDRLYLPAQFATLSSEPEEGSSLNAHYDTLDEYQVGVGLTAVGDDEVLITGGRAADVKLKEPDPRISQAANNARKFGSAVGVIGGGILTGIGLVGGFTMLGGIGLAFGILGFASVAISSMLNSIGAPVPNSQWVDEGSHFYVSTTNQFNWIFSEDTYAALRNKATVEDNRAVDDNGFLAPPKELLRDDAPPADHQTAGKNTGYKFEITFDQQEINPLPGSVHTGKVRLVDSQGRLVPQNTAIGLNASSPGSRVKREGYMETTNVGDSRSEYNPFKIEGYSSLEVIPETKLGSIKPTNGGYEFQPSDFTPGVYNPNSNGQGHIVLVNGEASFTLKTPPAHQHKFLTLRATASELPVTNSQAPYQIVASGSEISTQKSIYYGDRSKEYPLPQPPQKTDTQFGYEYTLTAKGNLAKPGDKMTLTLDAKGTLPTSMKDTVTINLKPAYQVFNKNQRSTSTDLFGGSVSSKGSYVETYAGEFSACKFGKDKPEVYRPVYRICAAGLPSKVGTQYSGQPVEIEIVRTNEPSMLPYLTFEIESIVTNPQVPKLADGRYATTVKRQTISIPLQ